MNWIDLREQKEQKENVLNELSKENLFYSEQINAAKSIQKRSVIIIAVLSVFGFFSLCAKSGFAVFIFLIAGFFLIWLAFSMRDMKNASKMIDENCARKIEFEKEIDDLNNKINTIKINW